MRPQTAYRRLVLGLLVLAFCGDPIEEEGDAGIAYCVPGASAMCWCNGVTPGVQLCRNDMTFAPCMCDELPPTEETGSTTEWDSETEGSTTSGSSEGNDPEDEATGGPGDDSAASTGGAETTGGTTGGTTDGRDERPIDCTDELFSLWSACRALASLNNPSPCGPCVMGNLCENAKCTIDCNSQGNPGLDAAITECDTKYPQCDGIYDVPETAYQKCVRLCLNAYNTCMASNLPGCEQADVSACSTQYLDCFGGC